MIINDGDYLSAKKAKDGSTIVIQDEGKITDNNKYKYEDGNPRKDFVFTVTYEGAKKLLRMNKASRTALCEAWGNDTAKWIGMPATINIFPTPNGGEKMIVLKPVNAAPGFGLPKKVENWEP